ncbi:MAG: DNA double-strand break repair protein Mre11, partial [Campylobacterota bacterium]|nr:DNA double-strand break repair protein Mre11 [Campylobacterota bacterium]
SISDKRNSKGYVELILDDENSLFGKLQTQYKEINIRPIVSKVIDAQMYESSLEALTFDDTQNAIVEVKLTNLTPLQSIEIQNTDITKLFTNAMSVTIKREFKSNENASSTADIESLTLREYFLEHIKEDASENEFERLKDKIDELFSDYEESLDDTH